LVSYENADRTIRPSNIITKEDLQGLNNSEDFSLRKARVSDVEGILALIDGYAKSNLMLPRAPKYLCENIRDFVVMEACAGGALPEIIACGSLHVLWEDIAEIRSLATHPQLQQHGLGSKIIQYLIGEARQIGVGKVFAFTLEEKLFERLGFKPVSKDDIPAKVWGECMCCPKYFECDETGFILGLRE